MSQWPEAATQLDVMVNQWSVGPETNGDFWDRTSSPFDVGKPVLSLIEGIEKGVQVKMNSTPTFVLPRRGGGNRTTTRACQGEKLI